MMYDFVIIGGGPAGVAAGVYAARKKISTALITDYFGGQSLVSADVQNWIGTKSVSGFDLGEKLKEHLLAYSEVQVFEGDRIITLEKQGERFVLSTEQGKKIEAKTILLATGSSRKKLDVPGEKEFEGKGVAYCSICDAPLFDGKDVAVVGGGNAGLEAVIDLIPYAKKIYLLHRRDSLKGDKVTEEKIRSNSSVEVILSVQTKEILGDVGGDVTGIKLAYQNGDEKIVPVGGVFVEVGIRPNSDLVQGIAEINNGGEVIVNHKTQETTCKGIWAAGDVSDVRYKQNNISVGDAIKAVLNIYEFLQSH